MKAVIIDDEQNNIDNLQQLLRNNCSQIDVVAIALTANDAKEIIINHNPDLVFLDIQMPGKNGFELLQSLPHHNFELIFVTAFDQYGIQAVKFAAIDYLLKPININELVEAVNKATQKINQKKQNAQLENLLQLLQYQQQKEEHRIALPASKETRFVHPKDIVRCESSNNYTTFFIVGGEKILVSKPIYEFDELLHDYGFVRCHQSHLVNKKFIKSLIKQDGGYLILYDNTQLPVSRNKKEEMKSIFSK